MKIQYYTLTGKSGGDVYFNLLMSSQKRLNNTVCHQSYHRNWSFFPYLLKPFIKINSECDLIHSNAEYGFVFKQNCPLIISVLHIIDEPLKKYYLTFSQKKYYSLMLSYIKQSLKMATFVVAISKASEQTVKKLYDIPKIQTIYCGIDTDVFKPITIPQNPYFNKIKLLFVGNLTKRKGVDLLPKIMEKLDNRFLLFYTTGLRTPKVIFSDRRLIPLGRLSTDELVYWYNLCDICLLPTRLEGFGYAIAEAMACGKPVVTTNCSSLPEIVSDGENGFLCEMDNVADFVDKIRFLADNPQVREEMGIRNRQKIVENFNLEKMGKEYNQLYKRVIEEFYGHKR
ncbi:MAG: glycosyltransferase family 4 protein [candidate division WOR-3 bacterium]